MTPIRFSPSSLREGRWYEYVIRFALGGAGTLLQVDIERRQGNAAGRRAIAKISCWRPPIERRRPKTTNSQSLVTCANFERGLFKNAAHPPLTMALPSLKIKNSVPYYGTAWRARARP